MLQLIQNFKTGELYVDEVPIPSISTGMVLVENRFSLISAGTEKSTVSVGKASLLGKARQRPDLVAQVIQNIKKEGFKATLEKVRTKLDSLKALGYSTSGVVMSSLDNNGIFKTGDRVACAGQDYASHAEVVSVPQNLVVKIPDNVSFEEASFTTLGAIAMQGIRQANIQVGENIGVIGLGLLGQLTCEIAKASGCKVLGIDISSNAVQISNKLGTCEAYSTNDQNLISNALAFSNGHGLDKVIITASAPTNEPILLASEILRKKGTIIIVGSVKMDLPREPFFYKKELELKMSCSYGPGRYDVNYEEEGIDFPYQYVRFTEQRNMESFLQLISSGKINVKPFISEIFDIQNAVAAYDIVSGKVKKPFIGLLLRYNEQNIKKFELQNITSKPLQNVNVAFIGAGSFAQSYLIPNVKKYASLDTAITFNGLNAKNVASKFGFNNAGTNASAVFENKDINTVFIATQHDTHAKYVIEALRAEKAVFVEKPLTIEREDIKTIYEVYKNCKTPYLMVGYNRRFSPLSVRIKDLYRNSKEPLMLNFRINAGFIPAEHWTQTSSGGGRILGEVCHFVDLMLFLTGSKPVRVYASSLNTENISIKTSDNVGITINFENGSVGTILYIANGDKAMPKERLEVFGAGKCAVIDDFKYLQVFSQNKTTKIAGRGKGHSEEVLSFFNSLKTNGLAPISFEELLHTSFVTFKIIDSLTTSLPQIINIEEFI